MSEEETWNIELGDEAYVLMRLPIKISRKVYPICQRLSNANLADRVITPKEPLQLTDGEMDDLITLAFMACQAVNPGVTKEVFDEMAITPPQLYDTFFAMRKACGGWRSLAEGQKPPGEATVTEEPPT